MFKNYLMISFRNLLKNKVFSMVNISGLAIGMAACFFIFLYVRFELSYDRFNKNAANLYRVNISFSGSFANLPMMATNHPALGPAMKADFPEVKDFARVVTPSLFMSASTITYTDKKSSSSTFNEDKIYIADPSFLRLFSFPFASGNPATALDEEKSIVISTTASKKYFGDESAIGKTLVLNKQLPLKVSGVFEDVPENSHIKFDMLISFKARGDKWGYDNWGWPEFYNYVLLAPGTDPKKVEAKLPAFTDKYLGAVMKQLNFGCQFHLQPVTGIHLKGNYVKEPEANGSERDVWFLSIIGVLILVVAWINYINLSTAKSMERAKEVGLRKVVGASRFQLIVQFIMESVIINLFALLCAAIIVLVCFPYFSGFIGKNISGGFLSSGLLQQPSFWLGSIGLFITGAFLVGAYPAFVLSHYKPVLVLKGKFFQSVKGIFLRKSLVSFQFVLSILLIAGTIMVYRQLAFMRNQSLGYNKDQVLVVKAPPIFDSTFTGKVSSFEKELLRNPAITGVAASSDVPGKAILGKNTVRRAGEDKTHNFITNIMETDENFAQTFQMQLASGRSFLLQDSTDYHNPTNHCRVMVNEEVIKALGFKTNEEAIHQQVIFGYGSGETRAEIIGVVKNYHQRSLKEVYDPILYCYPSFNSWKYLSVHVNTANLGTSLSSIETSYKTIFAGNPFESFFLNEFFNSQYQSDQRFGKVFTLFTVLAIFVACLGLLGLSSFLSRLRIKEIGVRKVLGASTYNILVLFSKDFIKLVCIASLIAAPITYFMADRWLRNYAFHIKLNWYFFILPSLLLLVICLITISIQSIRAALANPVKSLRAE